MDRRKFLNRFLIGAAALVVAPKVIAEVTKSKELYYPAMKGMSQKEFGTLVHAELEKCINSREYFYRNYFTVNGKMVVYGTAGENDPDAFKWHELEPHGEYQIMRFKSRRRGYRYAFPVSWDESGKFPLIK